MSCTGWRGYDTEGAEVDGRGTGNHGISAVATPIYIKAAEGRVKPSEGQFPLEMYLSL